MSVNILESLTNLSLKKFFLDLAKLDISKCNLDLTLGEMAKFFDPEGPMKKFLVDAKSSPPIAKADINLIEGGKSRKSKRKSRKSKRRRTKRRTKIGGAAPLAVYGGTMEVLKNIPVLTAAAAHASGVMPNVEMAAAEAQALAMKNAGHIMMVLFALYLFLKCLGEPEPYWPRRG